MCLTQCAPMNGPQTCTCFPTHCSAPHAGGAGEKRHASHPCRRPGAEPPAVPPPNSCAASARDTWPSPASVPSPPPLFAAPRLVSRLCCSKAKRTARCHRVVTIVLLLLRGAAAAAAVAAPLFADGWCGDAFVAAPCAAAAARTVVCCVRGFAVSLGETHPPPPASWRQHPFTSPPFVMTVKKHTR